MNNKIKAVIGDWAGSLVDKGSLAPVYAFIDTFKKHHINITADDTRQPLMMGSRKDMHIRQILKLKHVNEMWENHYSRPVSEKDIVKLYNDLLPIQINYALKHNKLIDGAVEFSKELHKRNIKFGITTGYTKKISDQVLIDALKQGIEIDNVVAGDDVSEGNRPYPYMIFLNMEQMRVVKPSSVLKFDDTVNGIEEGLNAGCWTVGVAKWSTYTNYNSIEHINNCSIDEQIERTENAKQILLRAGAHFVVDDINDIPDIITFINKNNNH
jgi:phosphonoacetaldehyde hydrolase